MKWNWRQHIVAFLILAAVPISLAVTFQALPERVPTHFGMSGKADGFMSREDYAVFIIAMTVAVYLLLTFIPFIDPFWKRIQHRYGLLLLIRDLALGFFLFIHLLSLDAASTGVLNVRLFGIGFGLLFVVMGNFLPRIPRNWFFGIRVPWTLASEEVWRRTHRLGGWLFVLGGCVTILLSAAGLPTVVALAVPLGPVVLIVAFIYPFILYRSIQKTEGEL